jgi:hypothetical protein
MAAKCLVAHPLTSLAPPSYGTYSTEYGVMKSSIDVTARWCVCGICVDIRDINLLFPSLWQSVSGVQRDQSCQPKEREFASVLPSGSLMWLPE